ncbi:hypothetical protein BDR26DRAFT_916708 [Obelidium mucronatum]|nr:hypothetical protein BDR26DRAFT_916708 [Obelidium mucronatum]
MDQASCDLPPEEKEIDAAFDKVWGVNGHARMARESAEPDQQPVDDREKKTNNTQPAQSPSQKASTDFSHASRTEPSADRHRHHHNPHHHHHPAPPSAARSQSSIITGGVDSTSGSLPTTVPATRPQTGYSTMDFEDPTQYLEERVFPILLPGIEKMLKTVKRKDGVEELSDPLSWLGHYLQRHNVVKQCAEVAEKGPAGAEHSKDLLARKASAGTQAILASVKIQRRTSRNNSVGSVLK